MKGLIDLSKAGPYELVTREDERAAALAWEMGEPEIHRDGEVWVQLRRLTEWRRHYGSEAA
jgi:hypothetical protein